jgi:hypothetical protein
VRQPRWRWVSRSCCCLTHRFVRIAARTVVASGVSHKNRVWRWTCGSCWSCATAAIAVGQSQLSLSDTPLRPNRGPYRRGLRRLPRGLWRAADLGLAQNLWELLELCDSRDAVGQSQMRSSDTPLRPNRGPYRRDLRRLPRGASPGIATLATDPANPWQKIRVLCRVALTGALIHSRAVFEFEKPHASSTTGTRLPG